MTTSRVELGTKNYFVGEDQQQFRTLESTNSKLLDLHLEQSVAEESLKT
jgi:hypothetical protein